MVLYRLDKIAWKVNHNHELNKICNIIIVDRKFFFARVAILIGKKLPTFQIVGNCLPMCKHRFENLRSTSRYLNLLIPPFT